MSGIYGELQSAGLPFFAFAGYARIATMAEEVREPQRTIPRAIMVALGITIMVYAVVAVTALLVLGSDRLARSGAPLLDVVASGAGDWAVPIVAVGGAAGALGALLALIAGIGRTTLAMARQDDLPGWFAAVHGLREVIGFSSFGVLLYDLVANLSAFTQDRGRRRFPRVLQVLGAVGCLVLVATLPWQAVAVGTGVIALGIAYRVVRLATAQHRSRAG